MEAGGVSADAGTAIAGQFGTLTLYADGSYSYEANASVDAGSQDVFTYTMQDGDGDISQATLTIGFDGDNNAPTAYDAAKTIQESGLRGDGTETVGTNGGANTMPRVRGTLAQDWGYAGLAMSLQYNYILGYYQQLLPGSYFTAQDPRFQTGTYPDRIPNYYTFDLFGRYQVNKNLRLTASVTNLDNKKPPYDPGFSSTFLYDFSMYSVVGRAVRVGFN